MSLFAVRQRLIRLLSYHKSILICLVSFVAAMNGLSQTYFFDNYKTTDGIESSKIYSICQANDGFVWLGTDVGITRFDGSHFDNFTIKDGLGEGGVRVIYKDTHQNLWIGHEGGDVTRYDGRSFHQMSHIPITSNITSITQDKEGCIWITSYQNGAVRLKNPYGKNEPEIRQYTGKELSDIVFNSCSTASGKFFVITDIGIRIFDESSQTFSKYNPGTLDTYFQFSVIFEDQKKNIWYGTYNGGLYKQDAATGHISYFDVKNGIASNWITDILQDRLGNIWISHWDLERRGGITRILPDGRIQVFNQENGLHDNKIWCLEEDLEGNILIGTTEHGLDIYKGGKFLTFSISNGLIHNQVNAICEDSNGFFWFGTNGGISVFDPVKKVFTSYNQESNQISNQIRFLRTDLYHNIWIGTEDQGVQLFDLKSNRFVSKPEINERFSRVSKSVWAMEIDQNNVLWIGTVGGLIAYDISKGSCIKTYGQIDGLPSNEIQCLYCDHSGRLWVGTKNSGLAYFNGDKFVDVPFENKITVNSVCEDSKGRLITGTEAHGIFILDQDSVIDTYTINDGLYTNNTRFICTDDFDHIYVGTTVGLNKIITERKRVLSYSKRNGFTGIETKSNAVYRDSRNRLWFGTVEGVTCYNPQLDQSSPMVPITHIKQLLVNGEITPIVKKLEFPSFKNNILINFSSISITDPGSVRYRIMLEGTDSGWEEVGTAQTANYRSLPPGRYTFKVWAVNSHGMSVKNPETLSFTILAPIYLRPWFIYGSIVLMVIGIFLIVKMRERNLITEKRILAEKVSERTLELSRANNQLAEKNKDITDSIYYARRIQFAILPSEIPYENTFVYFQPKDIVSGDFFWAAAHNGKEFLTVVDCTGHGVPGAFMSVIGHTSLNKIIIEQKISKPSDILQRLNDEVTYNLHQKEGDLINDGMDLAFICYDPVTRSLEFAGAFNPAWIIRNDEVLELKADRFAIGRSTGEEKKQFNNQIIPIEANDTVYLFTDGFADQFGGDEGKKYKSSRLKAFLQKINHLDMPEQCKRISDEFSLWKGNLEQVDDVLIIGRRFH